jgi:hypothetical protein
MDNIRIIYRILKILETSMNNKAIDEHFISSEVSFTHKQG